MPIDSFDWPIKSLWSVMRGWIVDEEVRERLTAQLTESLFFPDDAEKKAEVTRDVLTLKGPQLRVVENDRVYPGRLRVEMLRKRAFDLKTDSLYEALADAGWVGERGREDGEEFWAVIRKGLTDRNRQTRSAPTSPDDPARAEPRDTASRSRT
jgi:hypothetical protein